MPNETSSFFVCPINAEKTISYLLQLILETKVTDANRTQNFIRELSARGAQDQLLMLLTGVQQDATKAHLLSLFAINFAWLYWCHLMRQHFTLL
jgi:hypothetical protein